MVVSFGAMVLPVVPASVTAYDVVKDLGFPVAVALILLFQIVPKLDDVLQAQTVISQQAQNLTAACLADIAKP